MAEWYSIMNFVLNVSINLIEGFIVQGVCEVIQTVSQWNMRGEKKKEIGKRMSLNESNQMYF